MKLLNLCCRSVSLSTWALLFQFPFSYQKVQSYFEILLAGNQFFILFSGFQFDYLSP